MASSIGIKLADGSFFPILDEEPSSERDLELTTMRDDQESVQINLFKKEDENEPEYIGSLIVEELAEGIAGDPTINLKIKLDEDENLSAEAVDLGSGSKQSLKVSLKTLAEDAFDIPDFDLSVPSSDLGIGDDPNRDDVFVPDVDSDDFISSDESIEEEELEEEEEEESPRRRFPLWAIILIILLCIGALVFAILLLTKPAPEADKNKVATTDKPKVEQVDNTNNEEAVNETTTTPPTEDPDEKAAAEAKKKAEEEAKARAEAQAKADEEARQKAEAEEAARKKKAEEEAKRKAAASNKAPKPDSRGVVRYRLKWGDTLWDLSESFYKNPWDYIKIARYNNIKNPNVVIAGTYIEIPPK